MGFLNKNPTTMPRKQTITISRQETDSSTFALVLHTTLERLHEEEWSSRIFQFGNEGVMIVASRFRNRSSWFDPSTVQPNGLPPPVNDDTWEDVDEALTSAGQEALERVFDMVGPVPDELLLDSIQLMVPVALGDLSTRTLERAVIELEENRDRQASELDETDDHSFMIVLDVLVESIRTELKNRVN